MKSSLRERVRAALPWEPMQARSIAHRVRADRGEVRAILAGLVLDGLALRFEVGDGISYARRPEPAPRMADLLPADPAETMPEACFSFACGGAF